MRLEDYTSKNVAYHKELCPLAWQNNKLRPEVRNKLLQIAIVFRDYLDIEDFQTVDIVLTGSMANYNYTDYSDFDIHLITRYSDLKCDDLAEAFYTAKKKIWNDEHDIKIRGHEAELYVEDTETPPVSGGIYSILDNRWIKKPEYDPPKINERDVNHKVQALMIQIDKAIEYGDTDDLGKLFDKIKRMRKNGLEKTGEFGPENLTFKILRNQGYIEKLVTTRREMQDQQLSLKEIQLHEAKPTDLNNLDKLWTSYQRKDSRDPEYKCKDGLEVATTIFDYVGPKYLIWAAKQYNLDQFFFLHDLPEWQRILEEFTELKNRRVQLSKSDINTYTNIHELHNEIEKHKKLQPETSNFFRKLTAAVDHYVNEGQARWLYRSDNYKIYQPLGFEASNAAKKYITTNVCTIMNDYLFNEYKNVGTLIYTFDHKKLYICYISKNYQYRYSEFSDERNDHKFDLDWQCENFPELKKICKKHVKTTTDLSVRLYFAENTEMKYKICFTAVQEDPENLELVPPTLRTYEICMLAVEQGGSLRWVPKELRTLEICEVAIETDPHALIDVPLKFKTAKFLMAAIKFHGEAVQYVPQRLYTEEMGLAAVKQNPASLQVIPVQDRTLAICQAAFNKNPNTINFIPYKIREQLR